MPLDKSSELGWDKEKWFWNPVSTPNKSDATTRRALWSPIGTFWNPMDSPDKSGET
jgi:hypothetical protein